MTLRLQHVIGHENGLAAHPWLTDERQPPVDANFEFDIIRQDFLLNVPRDIPDDDRSALLTNAWIAAIVGMDGQEIEERWVMSDHQRIFIAGNLAIHADEFPEWLLPKTIPFFELAIQRAVEHGEITFLDDLTTEIQLRIARNEANGYGPSSDAVVDFFDDLGRILRSRTCDLAPIDVAFAGPTLDTLERLFPTLS